MADASLLPPGRYLNVSWSFEEDGSNTSIFDRSRRIHELTGRPVDVLLLSHHQDVAAVRTRLEAAGTLHPGVRLRGMWEELAAFDDGELRSLHCPHEPTRTLDDVAPSAGTSVSTRRNTAGNVLQRDRFRADGTCFLSERMDVRKQGTVGGKLVTVFDSTGTAIAEWPTSTEFYHAFVDLLVGDEDTLLFSDSLFVGRIFASHRNPHVTRVQLLHAAGLAASAAEGADRFDPPTTRLLAEIDGYHLVTTPTRGHRDDLATRGLATEKTEVVPVCFEPDGELVSDPRKPRTTGRGVGLVEPGDDARVDHALRAVKAVHDRGLPVELDLHWSGTVDPAVSELASLLGMSDRVHVHGDSADPTRHFRDAEFGVLCRTSDDRGDRVLASMSAGSIPIAYDVPYGPGEIIEHGVSGFLVPDGDETALADTIAHVVGLPEEEKIRIRRAGRARVTDFSPEAVSLRWARALERAKSRTSAPLPASSQAVLDSAEFVEAGVRRPVFVLRGHLAQAVPTLDVRLAVVDRKHAVYFRLPAHLEIDDGVKFNVTVPESRLLVIGDGLFDLSLDFLGPGGSVRSRITGKGASLPCRSPRVDVYTTKWGNLSAKVLAKPRR